MSDPDDWPDFKYMSKLGKDAMLQIVALCDEISDEEWKTAPFEELEDAAWEFLKLIDKLST